MHQLYTSLGIPTLDVIEAASTKWNFMKLTPGLVGGHCISIDPYYLMHKSEVSGYVPNIMRSARRINDEMGLWVIKKFKDYAYKKGIDLNKTNITFFGYSFKENCSDTRNTKVKDIMISLLNENMHVSLWDPVVDKHELDKLEKLGIKVYRSEPNDVELVFLCVKHDEVQQFLRGYQGLLFDFKSIYS